MELSAKTVSPAVAVVNRA